MGLAGRWEAVGIAANVRKVTRIFSDVLPTYFPPDYARHCRDGLSMFFFVFSYPFYIYRMNSGVVFYAQLPPSAVSQVKLVEYWNNNMRTHIVSKSLPRSLKPALAV